MFDFNSFKNKVVADKGRLYQYLRRFHRFLFYSNFPSITPLYVFLRAERALRHAVWRRLKSFLYYEPMFKTFCSQVGRELRLYDDIPKVFGRVDIRLGDRVSFEGDSLIAGGKVHSDPYLSVGDDSYIGYHAQILVGEKVEIGAHVLIANYVFLAAYDSHPLDPMDRANNLPPTEEGSGSIWIGDYVWIGNNATILKNVRIGEGAVVATGAVVTKDVPAHCVVAGNPARIVKRLKNTSLSVTRDSFSE